MTVTHSRSAALFLIGTLAVGCYATSAHAGTVTITQLEAQDVYAVGQRLIGTFKFNLRGAQLYAATQTTLHGAEAFDPFAAEWARANIARMQYRWTNASGVPRVTVYHAISGKTPAAAMGIDATSGYAAYTMPSWKNFYNDKNPNIYAHIIHGETTALNALPSVYAPGESLGVGHRYDAEMRALRTLERDIIANNLPRGGRVVMWTSAPPCTVCRQAMQIVSDTYGIDMQVFHMPAPSADAPQVFKLVQMTKNRLMRNFHQRVENERGVTGEASCLR